MKQRVIRMCGIALLVVAGGLTPGGWTGAPPEPRPGLAWAQALDADALVIESLGEPLAVDVYLLQCTGPALCARPMSQMRGRSTTPALAYVSRGPRGCRANRTVA